MSRQTTTTEQRETLRSGSVMPVDGFAGKQIDTAGKADVWARWRV